MQSGPTVAGITTSKSAHFTFWFYLSYIIDIVGKIIIVNVIFTNFFVCTVV